MNQETLQRCRAVLEHHSKSFALAAKMLPSHSRDAAAAVYAWCRLADDAVDLASGAEAEVALQRLHDELRSIYDGESMAALELQAFQEVVHGRNVPQEYPAELLAGMAMDVRGTDYRTMQDLLLYCFRVAGTVGLMMCHVMGLRDPAARREAAHLGIAMQLTNICRDVLEDWQRGRLYVPDDVLASVGASDLREQLGQPFPDAAVQPMAKAVESLLDSAESYYRSGDRGLLALSSRCAFAVGAARQVYSAIGKRVRQQGCDVTRGRAFVPRWQKALLLARAAGQETMRVPKRWRRRLAPTAADSGRRRNPIHFPQDVLPV